MIDLKKDWRKVLYYAIPIYCIWFILHIISFVATAFVAEYVEGTLGWLFVILVPAHILIILLAIALTVGMVIDVAMRPMRDNNEKIIWILIITLLGLIGPIIYFYMRGKEPFTTQTRHSKRKTTARQETSATKTAKKKQKPK